MRKLVQAAKLAIPKYFFNSKILYLVMRDYNKFLEQHLFM